MWLRRRRRKWRDSHCCPSVNAAVDVGQRTRLCLPRTDKVMRYDAGPRCEGSFVIRSRSMSKARAVAVSGEAVCQTSHEFGILKLMPGADGFGPAASTSASVCLAKDGRQDWANTHPDFRRSRARHLPADELGLVSVLQFILLRVITLGIFGISAVSQGKIAER